MTATLLSTAIDGPEDAPVHLVLHDRYGDLTAGRELGTMLGDAVHRISVQAPRLQTSGGSGKTYGHYWYIGPLERPELSSFGDGLFQLERLLLLTSEQRNDAKIGLLAQGEGASMALVLALLWPDKISGIIAIDGALPTNLDNMPIEPQKLDGLPVELRGTVPEDTADYLRRHGAEVSLSA